MTRLPNIEYPSTIYIYIVGSATATLAAGQKEGPEPEFLESCEMSHREGNERHVMFRRHGQSYAISSFHCTMK